VDDERRRGVFWIRGLGGDYMHIGYVILIQIVGAVGRFVTRTIYNGFCKEG